MSTTDSDTSDSLRRAAADLDAVTPELAGQDLESLFARVQERMREDERGLRGLLRSRPTWQRRALVLLAMGLPMVHAALRGPRANFHDLDLHYLLTCSIVLAVGSIAAAWVATRPLHLPGLPRNADGISYVLALLAVSVVAIWGHLDEALSWGELVRSSATCAAEGVALAVPIMLVAHFVDRGSWLTPLLATVAGALLANTWLLLMCPLQDMEHCLLGHSSVAIWLLPGLFLMRRLNKR